MLNHLTAFLGVASSNHALSFDESTKKETDFLDVFNGEAGQDTGVVHALENSEAMRSDSATSVLLQEVKVSKDIHDVETARLDNHKVTSRFDSGISIYTIEDANGNNIGVDVKDGNSLEYVERDTVSTVSNQTPYVNIENIGQSFVEDESEQPAVYSGNDALSVSGSGISELKVREVGRAEKSTGSYFHAIVSGEGSGKKLQPETYQPSRSEIGHVAHVASTSVPKINLNAPLSSRSSSSARAGDVFEVSPQTWRNVQGSIALSGSREGHHVVIVDAKYGKEGGNYSDPQLLLLGERRQKNYWVPDEKINKAPVHVMVKQGNPVPGTGRVENDERAIFAEKTEVKFNDPINARFFRSLDAIPKSRSVPEILPINSSDSGFVSERSALVAGFDTTRGDIKKVNEPSKTLISAVYLEGSAEYANGSDMGREINREDVVAKISEVQNTEALGLDLMKESRDMSGEYLVARSSYWDVAVGSGLGGDIRKSSYFHDETYEAGSSFFAERYSEEISYEKLAILPPGDKLEGRDWDFFSPRGKIVPQRFSLNYRIEEAAVDITVEPNHIPIFDGATFENLGGDAAGLHDPVGFFSRDSIVSVHPATTFRASAPQSGVQLSVPFYQIADTVARMSDGTVELKLYPEELGRVRMFLVSGETGLTVNILVDKAETLELMRRNADELARHLADAGFEGAGFSFGRDNRESENEKASKSIVKGPDEAVEGPVDDETPVSSDDGLDLRI